MIIRVLRIIIILKLAHFETKVGEFYDEETGENKLTTLALKMSSKADETEVAQIASKTDRIYEDDSEAEFNVGDENGNVIAKFKGGGVITKNFKSHNVPACMLDDSEAEFNVGDENGNVIVEFSDGHIKTKNFDSKNIILNNKLNGKRISILGDSISTYDGLPDVTYPFYPKADVKSKECTWWGQLCANTGMEICRVNAVGGATISNKNISQRVPFCDISRYGSLYSNGTSGDSPDIIVVLGGVNDWNCNADLGTYDDDFSSSTDEYIPSVRFLMKQLLLKYTTSKIFFCTPVRSWYEINKDYPPTKNDKSLQEFVDATKKCGSLHGIATIDLYNNLSINEGNMELKLIDKLHPKKSGCTDIAKFIESELERLY